jgi:hypothetical protein
VFDRTEAGGAHHRIAIQPQHRTLFFQCNAQAFNLSFAYQPVTRILKSLSLPLIRFIPMEEPPRSSGTFKSGLGATMSITTCACSTTLHTQPRSCYRFLHPCSRTSNRGTVGKSVVRPNGRSYFANRLTPQVGPRNLDPWRRLLRWWAITVSTGDADDILRDGFA